MRRTLEDNNYSSDKFASYDQAEESDNLLVFCVPQVTSVQFVDWEAGSSRCAAEGETRWAGG